jgi:hypothetical protein
MPSFARRDENAADVTLCALIRIGGGGAEGQALQDSARRCQLPDAPLNMVDVSIDERLQVLTRWMTRVADCQHAANIRERQPRRLGLADEPEPHGGLGREIPVVSSGPGWGGQ